MEGHSGGQRRQAQESLLNQYKRPRWLRIRRPYEISQNLGQERHLLAPALADHRVIMVEAEGERFAIEDLLDDVILDEAIKLWV